MNARKSFNICAAHDRLQQHAGARSHRRERLNCAVMARLRLTSAVSKRRQAHTAAFICRWHLYVFDTDPSPSVAPVSTPAQAAWPAPSKLSLEPGKYAPSAAGTLVRPSLVTAGFRAPVCSALSATAGCRQFPAAAPLCDEVMSRAARQPPDTAPGGF